MISNEDMAFGVVTSFSMLHRTENYGAYCHIDLYLVVHITYARISRKIYTSPRRDVSIEEDLTTSCV
jgi:hypothetical protein